MSDANQRVFSKVYTHLLTQKFRSLNESGSCMYRGKNDTKCAVGALIADEHYTPALERLIASSDAVFSAVVASGYPDVDPRLLNQLQEIHDLTPSYEWRDALDRCARRWDLTVPDHGCES